MSRSIGCAILHRRLTRRWCAVEVVSGVKKTGGPPSAERLAVLAFGNASGPFLVRRVVFLPNDMTLSLLFQSALSRQVKVSSAEPSRLADEPEGCAYA